MTALAVAVPAAPSIAKHRKPKPPTAKTMKRLLVSAYCPPSTNASGEAVTSVKVTFNALKRAKARVGDYATDGVPANRKTYVFPVRADYFCDYQYTNDVGTLKANDKHITGAYVFFKDEFGKWTQRNKNHNVEIVRGDN